MSLITLPNPTFATGATAIGSQVIANFTAITNVVNGSLDTTNFGTLAGAVVWSISTNVRPQRASWRAQLPHSVS
jgi:hypothetical protein